MNFVNESSTEWIVTFADLMTLLFCFFVLLTVLSTQPKNCEELKNYLEENSNQFINYELRSNKLECILSLPSDFLFRSGDSKVQRRALRALSPLFKNIRSMPEHENDLIIVEGHTDNVPIKTRKFKNNWELSAARAITIATFLMDVIDFPTTSVSTRAFAENRPKVSYVDDYGKKLIGSELDNARKRNRRVEIILTKKPVDLETNKLIFDGTKN